MTPQELQALELVRDGIKVDDVSADLVKTFRLLELSGMIELREMEGEQPPMPERAPMPTPSHKRAEDVRPGNWVGIGSTIIHVDEVYQGSLDTRHGVHINPGAFNSPCFPFGSMVDVFDGPLPEKPKRPPAPTWKEWRLTEQGELELLRSEQETTDEDKRSGRPRKGDTDKQAIVLSLLVVHHQYEAGGSVGNYEPIELKDLARRMNSKSKSTGSRFFKSKFGERGYKGYTNACARKEIGRLLAEWQNETSDERHDPLWTDEGEPGTRNPEHRKSRKRWEAKDD